MVGDAGNLILQCRCRSGQVLLLDGKLDAGRLGEQLSLEKCDRGVLVIEDLYIIHPHPQLKEEDGMLLILVDVEQITLECIVVLLILGDLLLGLV